MLKNCSFIILTLSLTSCSGLDINSISTGKAIKAHTDGAEVTGYIVYQPMIVVEVGEKELCLAKNAKGQCEKIKTVCGMGEPKILPDYSKPYLLNPKSGFGKAGVEVKIEDGWRLGGIKDTSDNTGLLSVLATAAGVESLDFTPAEDKASGCAQSGLYRLSFENGSMNLKSILKY